jgi:DNA-binding HxlR family transcriptional regulator
LRKNQRFFIIERLAYHEVPPRVEYVLTPFGTKCVRIVDGLKKLHDEMGSGTPQPRRHK